MNSEIIHYAGANNRAFLGDVFKIAELYRNDKGDLRFWYWRDKRNVPTHGTIALFILKPKTNNNGK